MWKVWLKVDAWILKYIQEIYLWLLDRTGVYVATACFSIYAIVGLSEVAEGGRAWLWGSMLIFAALSLIPKYLMQDRCENERFNAISMAMAGFPWRHWITIPIGLVAIAEVITLHPLSALSDFGFVLYSYLSIIMIRDRDKKPFFEKKQQLAMQEGS
jgi:hypothetical protein